MWPSGNGTVADGMQGTSLFTDPNETHSTNHRQIGTIVNSLTTVFGTTAGTGLFAGYAVGQLPLPIQSGTLGTLITKGTINTSVIGTSQFTGGTVGTTNLIGGTLAGQIQNNGTVTNGVYGTALYLGGTANNQTLGTPTLLGSVINTANIVTGAATNVIGTQGTALNQTGTTQDPTFTPITGGTVTLITSGSACLITGAAALGLNSDGLKCALSLALDGTQVMYSYGNAGAANGETSIAVNYYGIPSAGTHSWTLGVALESPGTFTIQTFSLLAMEFKK